MRGIALAVVVVSLGRATEAAARPHVAHAGGPRILPLGDAVVSSELARQLDAHGYQVVGDGAVDAGRVIRSFPSDPAPQLYGEATKRALEIYRPNIVLLMAGSGDLLRLAAEKPGYTLENTVDGMDALLAEIFYIAPKVRVVVAGVVASPLLRACDVVDFDGIDDVNGCGQNTGPNLTQLVAKYSARNFNIVLAPVMSTAVPRDKAHFPDGLHPSGPGVQDAIARVWMNAIARQTADAPVAIAPLH